MTETIGIILKKHRKALKLTQTQVCEGICAQSMLSAIEHDHYIPNAQLLIALCRQLEISLDALSLANNYAISDKPSFNQQMISLCNHHQYQQLLDFLSDDTVSDTVATDAQTQSYYYYLAVAQLQSTDQPDLNLVHQFLQLSLASATPAQQSLTRLTQATLAYLAAKSGKENEVDNQVKLALANIEEGPFDENLNIVFYLTALANYFLGKNQASVHLVTQGIDFITKHDSHYMLANCYYLIALIAESLGDTEKSSQSESRSDFLSTLFNEKVYKR